MASFAAEKNTTTSSSGDATGGLGVGGGVTVRFQPFSSRVDVSFWHELAKRKIEEYRLSTDPANIVGKYSFPGHADVPSRLSVDSESFQTFCDANNHDNTTSTRKQCECLSMGSLVNVNTNMEFKSINKRELLNKAGLQIWADIASGAVVANPRLLQRFVLLTYADLKTHRFLYWFAFPALVCARPFMSVEVASPVAPGSKINAALSLPGSKGKQRLLLDYFVLVEKDSGDFDVLSLQEWDQLYTGMSAEEQQQQHKKAILGFTDPCPLQQHPGWPLRNFLLLAITRWPAVFGNSARVLCHRGGPNSKIGSLLLNIITAGCIQTADSTDKNDTLCAWTKIVGWEANKRGKAGPRIVDLSSSMDPHRLAANSVDLNLKLMRWRLLPSLNTATLAATKCLLLGAGTLGCAVARSLMGWGVRHITFVDNGRVSFSNPVRQSLYEFEDCKNGGVMKAAAAAAKLAKIFPGSNPSAHVISIPMPGHPFPASQREAVMQDVALLRTLIAQHDVVFLLTDTRESRWLPTMLCAEAKPAKITLNAALGFDSFLVMRHGSNVPPTTTAANNEAAVFSTSTRLGCYFCNDVVAPQNSTRDRTLDQQCTVTRPGLAPMAGAMAVEMMVGLLHHPLREKAPASGVSSLGEDASDSAKTALGLLPHQIRGSLSTWNNVCVQACSFPQCTACSEAVVNAYREGGDEFLAKVFADRGGAYLDEMTGLAQLRAEVDDMDFDVDDEDW